MGWLEAVCTSLDFLSSHLHHKNPPGSITVLVESNTRQYRSFKDKDKDNRGILLFAEDKTKTTLSNPSVIIYHINTVSLFEDEHHARPNEEC